MTSGGSRHRGAGGRRTGRVLAWAAAGGLAAAVGAEAVGQFVRLANGMIVNASSDDQTNKSPGFSVRKEPQAITDAFEDFERYRDKKAWEKAFAALTKIDDAKPSPDRLVPGADGFYVTAGVKIQNELLSLPPEGKQAYRLFNDAKAEKMYADAVAGQAGGGAGSGSRGGGDDVPVLRKLVDQYFITSVGDQAADRLGDAEFEAGDFAGAERCWRLILDSYPDSTLAVPTLLAKRATALGRLNAWEQLDAVTAAAKDRYAGQKATVGGRDVSLADYLDGLRRAGPGRSGTQGSASASAGLAAESSWVAPPVPGGPPLTMPTSDVPAWQFPLMSPEEAAALEQQLANYGWGSLSAMFRQSVPATAVDERRVYCNWLGVAFALDAKTGKMLWRTEAFGNVPQKLTQSFMQGEMYDPQSSPLVVAGGKVLVGLHSSENRNYNEAAQVRLTCLSAEKGAKLWTTAKGPGSDLGIVGPPVVVGDAIYVTGTGGGAQELQLACFGLDKGEQRWRVGLGHPAAATNSRGQPSVTAPALLVRGDKVDVLTNAGAVVEVDVPTRRVEWAFTYPTVVKSEQPYYYAYAASPSPTAPGAAVARGSTLYFKELDGRSLYALETAGEPSVRWRRTVDTDDGLAMVDDAQMLLVGPDVENLDATAADHPMRFGIKSSVATGGIRPVVAGGHLYLLGSKGVEDVRVADGTAGGPAFRGYEPGGSGGTLWTTPDRLVTVTGRAITAYPLPTSPKVAAGGR